MAMNPQMGAAALAGGMPQGGMPQGGMPQGGMPQGGMPQGGMPQGGETQVAEIIESLKQILPQTIDEKGFVNMDKLLTMWPQISRIPFQTVMQLIQQNPEILNELIIQYGLSGIIVQGRQISADELASLGGRGGGGV